MVDPTELTPERVPPTDLRTWLEELRALGELVEIPDADPMLEVGALTDLNAKRRGPALLFTNLRGYPTGRLLSCSLSRAPRLATALGLPPTTDDQSLVSALRGQPREWERLASAYPPVEVADAPVLEHVLEGDAIDMRRFPAPLWHEGDGGHYLGTGCAVITRDPHTGVINAGTYRVSVHSARRLGLFIEPINDGAIHLQRHHELNEPCPVAVSFGHSPLVHLSASMPVPHGLDELSYAGAIAGRPLEVIRGDLTGLPIPAGSELAIEGWVEPGDQELEGPFGEFTGYFAGGRSLRPVINVERLYHRPDPIVYGSLPAKPPFDHSYWRSVLESSLLVDALSTAGIPDVRAAWKHEAGCANLFTVVALRERYAGHAMQAGVAAALVTGGVSMGRYVVVVDDDIDVMDLEEVIWAMSTRSDPVTSIQVLDNTPTNPLDPMLERVDGPWMGSRAVINACRPYHRRDTFPRVVGVGERLAREVEQRWGEALGWS